MPIHYVGKVHRRGTPVVAKAAGKRHARNCRSAPSVPANVTLKFARREMRRHPQWRAVTHWDPVTTDVAGRTVAVEAYQVQLRATDASGEPVETASQVGLESTSATGAEFTVHAGTAAATNYFRSLNASPDEIKKTLTGLTVGIEAVVHFFAMEDLVASAPRLRFSIYSVTDAAEVVAKNETLVSLSPRIYAALPFTPVAGRTYEARVSWVSGSGIGRVSNIHWHDRGESAQWMQMVPSDDIPFAGLFQDIPRPRSWYYQTRVRALNRVHGARCWSAWSAWTTATRPVDGVKRGPPVPENVTLVLDKVEGARGMAWRAKVWWNELSWWVPPDDDPVEGASLYHVQLAVSNNGGTNTANIRRKTVEADDEDANVTANAQFVYKIKGKRHYRARVKAQDEDGRRGAWSAWTAWASPGGVPNPVTGLVFWNPTPATFAVRWTEPADLTDVDRYRVQVIRANDSSVVDDGYTTANRWFYNIPVADRAINHRARVRTIEDPLILDVDEVAPTGWDVDEESSLVTSSDVANSEKWGITDVTAAVLAGTDTVVPSSHPTVTVQGGPGWLLAKWTAISNPDPVWYDVYVSATDLGSTVAAWQATTKVGTVDGSIPIFLTKTGAGSALAYGTTYFVAAIAKDGDGYATAALPTRGSAAMVKIPTVDHATGSITANEVAANTLTAGEIAANAITASEIAANAVTAAKLEATLVLATMLKAVGAGGRVEIDAAGIRLYNATSGGTNTVNLKSSDGSAWFRGEVRDSSDNPMVRPTGPPRCKVMYTAGLNSANSTLTTIRFGTEITDTDGFHAATTDLLSSSPDSTYNIVIPYDGQYMLVGHVQWGANGTGRRRIQYDVNGSGATSEQQMNLGAAPASEATKYSFVQVFDLLAADTVRMQVFQDSGVNLAIVTARLYIEFRGPV